MNRRTFIGTLGATTLPVDLATGHATECIQCTDGGDDDGTEGSDCMHSRSCDGDDDYPYALQGYTLQTTVSINELCDFTLEVAIPILTVLAISNGVPIDEVMVVKSTAVVSSGCHVAERLTDIHGPGIGTVDVYERNNGAHTLLIPRGKV